MPPPALTVGCRIMTLMGSGHFLQDLEIDDATCNPFHHHGTCIPYHHPSYHATYNPYHSVEMGRWISVESNNYPYCSGHYPLIHVWVEWGNVNMSNIDV